MPRVNQPIPLSLQLFDKATNKYITATVRLPSGAELDGSPVNLPHVSRGFYSSQELRMPAQDVSVFYEVFDDAAHTIPSADHSEAFEKILLTSDGGGSGGGGGDDIVAEVYDADISLVATVEEARTLRGVI